MTTLKLDFVNLEAATHAVTHWHYSERMPSGKLVRIGAWEDGKFIGVVLFGDGANKDLLKPYGLKYEEGCELVRVALKSHKTPVSRIVRIAFKLLKKACPGIRLVVSFADPDQGHAGGIYQAGNWLYVGKSGSADEYLLRGQRVHGRSLRAKRASMGMTKSPEKNALEWAKKYLDPNIKQVVGSSKHRYIYPLDEQLKTKLKRFGLKYPKNASEASCDAPDVQSGEGGSTPTHSLHPSGEDDGTRGQTN